MHRLLSTPALQTSRQTNIQTDGRKQRKPRNNLFSKAERGCSSCGVHRSPAAVGKTSEPNRLGMFFPPGSVRKNTALMLASPITQFEAAGRWAATCCCGSTGRLSLFCHLLPGEPSCSLAKMACSAVGPNFPEVNRCLAWKLKPKSRDSWSAACVCVRCWRSSKACRVRGNRVGVGALGANNYISIGKW